jgi:hypothetical protein
MSIKDLGTDDNKITEIDDEHVLICIERLQKLELLEKQLPKMIEAAIQEHKKNKLKMLHDKDKENPGAVNLRVKRYNEKHKDKINARRREKRKLDKDIKKPNNLIVNSVIESLNTSKAKKISLKMFENQENTPLKIPDSPTLNEVLTVRFDI